MQSTVKPPECAKPRRGLGIFFFVAMLATLAQGWAGHFFSGYSPGVVPWPGGVVPYEFDASLSAAEKQAYLDGLKEFELIAHVSFVPRTVEAEWVLFKYAPGGPNRVSGSMPQTVEIGSLRRWQIQHEMGHSFGLLHEHQRSDRAGFVTIHPGNVVPPLASEFTIDATGTLRGAYDFRSVMHYGRNVGSVPPGALDTITANAGLERWQVLMGTIGLSPGDREVMRHLYGNPVTPLSPVVTHTKDGGPGSLRAALHYADENPGSTIQFAIPVSDPGFANGVYTIALTGELAPLMVDGTVIDGTTQPGYAGKPLVFLDGSGILASVGEIPGLLIYAADCEVKGIAVRNFSWVGIGMRYAEAVNNRVAGCWCGMDATGAAAAPNAFQGVMLLDGASNNVIGGTEIADRNVLSGNAQYGVWIGGATTTGNVVAGNYIGTDWTGSAPLGNGLGGIIVTEGGQGNLIGGREEGAGNLISGNADAGVWLAGAGVGNNTVAGNLIGTNAAGTAALPNTAVGIYVVGGASGNTISGNVLSGNTSEGCRIADEGTTGNAVLGNFVGTNAAGDAAVPNGFAGLTIFNKATGNFLGGSGGGKGNTISGNGTYGVVIGDPGSTGNAVEGNVIGLGSGGAAMGNGFVGVAIWNGASGNMVGGTLPGAGNIIASHPSAGITLFDGAPTSGNTFSSNGIFNHGFQGIDLRTDTNRGQNPPVLTAASLGVTGTTVTGSLTSTPGATFRIEFFASTAPGTGEGMSFLGTSDGLVADGAGFVAIHAVIGQTAAAGLAITATATNTGTRDTSGFSVPVVVTAVDTDSDGMPDDYEMANGLNKNLDDAGEDLDDDGLGNLAEFKAGTDPEVADAFAAFAAESVVFSGDDVVVVFRSVPGRVYRVEKSESLSPGSFRVFTTFVRATGATFSVTDTGAALKARGFYRAAVLP